MNAPTWWERKTTPNSMPTWRVPNMTATRPEVGGTVESHSRPMKAANTSRRPGILGTTRNTAKEHRAPGSCRSAAGACSGGRRARRPVGADHVEQADQRERPRGEAAAEAEVAEVSGRCVPDERDVEAADEEPGREQQVARVRERGADRLAAETWAPRRARPRRRGRSARSRAAGRGRRSPTAARAP